MAFYFLCLNCGHEQEEHNPNLVNEPAEGDFAHIETPADGYPMSILQCMETKWPAAYAKEVEDLYWGRHGQDGYGYVSPDPKAEVAEYGTRPLGMQSSVLIVYDHRGSRVIQLD